ncbi:hypothetical protein ONA92_26640 [Mycobacteroides salmoniphilum]|uniref:hypothetical protein n=1 Tax=Mycobacteroides salmoniphilum TaxID=404941 RepID=UPI003563A74F
MIDRKERARDELCLVAEYRNKMNQALRELPADAATAVRKTAAANLREADLHLSRAIVRAISAGWPPNSLRSTGLRVDAAVARSAVGFIAAIIAAVTVLVLGCYLVPFGWAVGMAATAYGVCWVVELQADRQVFTRYTTLVEQLRQARPWWERARGSSR